MIPQPAGKTEASGIGVDGTPPPSPGVTTSADTIFWTPGLCDWLLGVGIGVGPPSSPSPGITACADTVVWTPGLCDHKRTQSAFSNNSVHDCDGTKR